MCVSMVHNSKRSNHDTITWYSINTSNATAVVEHTSSDLIRNLQRIQQRAVFSVCVCMRVSVRGVCAVIGTQDGQEERRFFSAKAASQPRSHKLSTKQSISSATTAAVLQALAFVPIVTVYVYVAGEQHQAGDRTTTVTYPM